MTDPIITGLSSQLTARAGRYFPDLADRSVDAKVVWSSRRQRSSLYRFALIAGDVRHDVLAKVTFERPSAQVDRMTAMEPYRPRLVPPTAREVKHEFEYRAAKAAHDHFEAAGDSRLTVVRPLDHLPELHALVVEFVEETTLHDLIVQTSRLRPSSARPELEPLFRCAGAWLRGFHAISAVAADPLRSTADELAAWFEEVTRFLAGATVAGNRPFARMRAVTSARIPELFAGGLPLALGHGDFAPRNIFAAPGGQIQVFDTLARYRVPVYEDLAHFRVALRTAALPMASFGLAFKPGQLERYERELVAGYFGDVAVPEAALAVFDLLTLVEKWASVVVTPRTREPRGRLSWTAYRALAEPQLRRRARALVRTIEAA